MPALPTLTKTWTGGFAHTQVAPQGSFLLDIQHTFRVAIVNALLALTGAPTVRGSSDSSTSNLTGTNLWSADNKLVFNTAGNAHSWIVLKFGSGKFELCIDLNVSGGTGASVILSIAGFTGGTTTARPTATDEKVLISSSAVGLSAATDISRFTHIWMPNDGSSLRIAQFETGTFVTWWHIDIPNPATVGWTSPYVAFVGAQTPTITNFSGTARMLAQAPGGAMTMFLTGEGNSAGLLASTLTTIGGVDAGFYIGPMGCCQTTGAQLGCKGNLVDCFWVSTGQATGAFAPSSGSATWVVVGNTLQPWDGTATFQTS
jgi:hypothetical protein